MQNNLPIQNVISESIIQYSINNNQDEIEDVETELLNIFDILFQGIIQKHDNSEIISRIDSIANEIIMNPLKFILVIFQIIQEKIQKEKEGIIKNTFLSNEDVFKKYSFLSTKNKMDKKFDLIGVKNFVKFWGNYTEVLHQTLEETCCLYKNIMRIIAEELNDVLSIQMKKVNRKFKKNFRFDHLFIEEFSHQITSDVILDHLLLVLKGNDNSLSIFSNFTTTVSEINQIIENNYSELNIFRELVCQENLQTEVKEKKFKNVDELVKYINEDSDPNSQNKHKSKNKKSMRKKKNKKNKSEKNYIENEENKAEKTEKEDNQETNEDEKNFEDFKKSLIINSMNAKQVVKVQPLFKECFNKQYK